MTGYGFGDPVASGVVHAGEDLLATPLTAVHAAADGCVVVSKEGSDGYGQVIVIEHQLPGGRKVVTIYGHLSKQTGYKMRGLGPVKRGDTVGFVGSDNENGDGGPHLHFGVKDGAFDGTYAGRGSTTNGFLRPTNILGRWDFRSTSVGWVQGRHGWSPRNAANRDSDSVTAWTLDPGASDPGVQSSMLGVGGVGLDPGEHNALQLSMKSCAPDGKAQVFFTTSADGAWTEAKSAWVDVRNDCAWHEVTVDFRSTAAWRDGRGIVQLRVDPARWATAGSSDLVSLDWIRTTKL